MSKVTDTLYNIHKYLIIFPFFALGTLVLGALSVLLSILVSERLGSRLPGKLWARLVGLVTPFSVDIHGAKNIDPD